MSIHTKRSNPSSEIFLGKEKEKLKEIMEEFFPIEDYTGKKFTLYFEDLYFDNPRYPLELCIKKKLTYDFPVYVKVRLVNKKTGTEKRQDVYFFNLPKMTSRGTLDRKSV